MTARLFVPALGPTDRRHLLAKPEKHWKRGRSTLELAVAWKAACETKSGIPDDVASVFNSQVDLSRPQPSGGFSGAIRVAAEGRVRIPQRSVGAIPWTLLSVPYFVSCNSSVSPSSNPWTLDRIAILGKRSEQWLSRTPEADLYPCIPGGYKQV